MKNLWIGASLLTLAACGQSEDVSAPAPEAPVVEEAVEETVEVVVEVEEAAAAGDIDAVLDAQADDVKARYQYRNPKETLAFFGVEPGMTVVDTLPGEVWYAGILIDLLGPGGKVIGADYSPDMWSLFGNFAPEPGAKDNWPAEWTEKAEAWRDADTDAAVGGMQFGRVTDDMADSVDLILMIRALHHFNRFEAEGGFLTEAVADSMKILKPGGHVGVVQHRAPEANSDEWASGDNGYVKQSVVVAAFEAAGFEWVGSSDVNANPNDQPTEDDFVWRLPPSFATSRDNPELKAEMEAIGESDRMTLLFKKPE